METYQCNITRFLDSICYRLQSISNTYHLDNSSLVTTQNHGCYYSNNWSPYHYSIEESSSISVRVYYIHSFIWCLVTIELWSSDYCFFVYSGLFRFVFIEFYFCFLFWSDIWRSKDYGSFIILYRSSTLLYRSDRKVYSMIFIL